MKTITIQRLTLKNFKGCSALDLDFGGKDASIYGDNATGKTTIYDSLCWLLFGKDSLGQSNDELIKPLGADGQVRDHNAVTTVEAVLTVCEDEGTGERIATGSASPRNDRALDEWTDLSTAARSPYVGMPVATAQPWQRQGKTEQSPRLFCPASMGGYTITLRKDLRELWTTRRGTTQAIYSGNTVDYYVDGVPIQKKGYTARIGELVDEETFRTLTSASAFAADLHWQKRRAVLADMSGAGALSDNALLQEAVRECRRKADDAKNAAEAEGVTAQADRFAALLDELNGRRSLDDEKKVLQQRQRDLKQAKNQTPARIDELQRQADRLRALDFAGAEVQLTAVRGELAAVRSDIAREEAESAESAEGGQIARATDKGTNPSTAARSPSPASMGGLTAAELGLRELEAQKAKYEAEWLRQRQEIVDQENVLNWENNAWLEENREEIRETQQAIYDLERENYEHRKKQAEALPDLNAFRHTVNQLSERVLEYQAASTEKESEAQKWDGLVDACRGEWLSANNASFTDGNCPTCGQALPMEMLAAAQDRFMREKAAKLKDIERRANLNSENAQQARAAAEDNREKAKLTQATLDKAVEDLEAARQQPREIKDLDGYLENLEALRTKQEALEAQIEMPDYQARIAPIHAMLKEHEAVKDMPGYAEAKAALEADLDKEHAQAVREAAEKDRRRAEARDRVAALRTKEKEAEGREKSLLNFLGQRSTLEYAEKRIGELRKEQQKAGAELEETEAMLFAIEDFIRWKMRFVEDSVNGLFRIVTFRLFRDQANGGVAECCDVVVDGVPYAAINNGARINAGLDIISRLGEHYGVRVPLFIDNAESVTRLEDAGTQVIRLVVSEQDKKLRVEAGDADSSLRSE